jgi:phage I-like protein
MIGEKKQIDLPDGELTVWCQIAPFGSFPGVREDADGKPETVTQLCDVTAFRQVVAAFAPEVLVDFEHRSENSDDTSAAAWVEMLEVRDFRLSDGSGNEKSGLFGLLRFTDTGAEAVRGRRLRFLSPVWPLDSEGRPVLLKSVALTNTPNFDLRPVLNKAPGGETKKGQTRMKELAALYGLPETATDAEVLAAAKAAKEESDGLKSRVAELEKNSLTAEANDVCDKNPNKVCNKADFVKLYVENKAMALAFLATVREAAPVCNKADAKKPFGVFGGAVQNKLTQYEALPEGKEKRQFLRDNAGEINTLRNQRDAAASAD